MAEFHRIAGYDVIATLGYGARSTIYAVRDDHGNVFAMKRVDRTSTADQRFIDQAVHEHDIAKQFDHPSLRKSHKVIRHRSFLRTRGVLVIMEMVEGITLEQLRDSSVLQIVEICQQVAAGLAVMHTAGYVHADIKPNNIMMLSASKDKHPVVKIIDFGQSCKVGTVKERIQGTPDYIAPEQVRRRQITPRTDVFNFGATMYWLLTRRYVPTLIPKGEPGVSLRTEERCVPPRELNPEIPPALSSLIMDCIEREPTDRPESMAEVIGRLDVSASQIIRLQKAEQTAQRASRHRNAS